MAKISNLLATAALAAALAVLAAPGAASAGPKQQQQAKVHIDRATRAHKAGQLDKALIELQAAYTIDPQPQLLYAQGQILTKLGRCSEASDAYLRFLASGVDPNTAQVVKQAIESCKTAGGAAPAPATEPTPTPAPGAVATQPAPGAGEDPLAGKAAPPPPPETAATAPPAAPPAPPQAARSRAPGPAGAQARPWYRDVLGDVLVVGGAASLVLGGLAYKAAVADLDTAETVQTHERYVELVDGAQTKRLIGVAMIGGGAVLITAGVLRFMLRDKHTEVRRVGMTPARGGGLFTWTRSF